MADWVPYRVVDVQHDEAVSKIEKINRRLAKQGLPEIELEWRGETEYVMDPDNQTRVIEYRIIYMRADLPAVADWDIVGVLHPSSEGHGNIVSRIPGASADLTPYYNAGFTCDHCGYLRRRNDTFLIEHTTTGEMKQVGSTCMKDFIKVADPHAVMKMAEILVDLDDFLKKPVKRGDYGKIADDPKEWTVTLLGFLAMCAKDIRERGRWIGAKEAWETGVASTGRAAWSALGDKSEVEELTREDINSAKDIIDWGRAKLDADSPNEYIHNLAVIVAGDYCSYREAGIVASIYRAKQRAEQDAAKKKVASKSNHVGTIGDRITRAVVVDTISSYHGHYGEVQIVKMRTLESQDKLVWWATNPKGLAEGDKVVITGRVKDHRSFNGQKETVITRCKVDS